MLNPLLFQLYTSSLWEIWSIPPASPLNPRMCCRVHLATHSHCLPVQPRKHQCIRLVGRIFFFLFRMSAVLQKFKTLEALIVHCFILLSLKRNLAESSMLKRGEAGRPVPSITISVPKPSFAPSAAADKISTLHKTGYYHCFNITWTVLPEPYVKVYLKCFFPFFCQVQAKQNSPIAKLSSSDRSTEWVSESTFLFNSLPIYRLLLISLFFGQKLIPGPILILFWSFISNFTLFHYCIRIETHNIIRKHG